MTFLFKIKIYDRHQTQDEDEDGEERFKKKEDKWYKFDLYIEVGKILIKDFREYVLWDDDNENPVKCVKITFTDDTYVYGAYAIIDTFVKEYEASYKPMYEKWYAQFYTSTTEEDNGDKTPELSDVNGNNPDAGVDDEEEGK